MDSYVFFHPSNETENAMTTNELNETVTNETEASASEASASERREAADTASASSEARASDPRVERTVAAAEHIVDAAVDIGRTWAAYGLRVGKLALETHASTMGKLAGVLGEINRELDGRRDETPPTTH